MRWRLLQRDWRLPTAFKGVFRRRKVVSGESDSFHLVSQARSELESCLPQVEAHFLAVGEGLDSLGSHCQAMLDQCTQLKDLAGGKTASGSSMVEDIRSLLTGPLEHIDFCLERQHMLLELLEQCIVRTREIRAMQSSMSDILAPLTFMTVLFKIESAALNEEQRSTFLTVTVEIERLREQVEQSFTRNLGLLDQTLSTLISVKTKVQDDQQKHGVRQAEKRRSIHASFDGLELQLTSNASRDSRMHEISAALSQEVSRVVIGLQFQDIFKQRCDQVLKGMASIPVSATRSELKQAPIDLSGPSAELDDGIRCIRDGIAHIREQMADLETNSLISSSGGDEDQSSAGFVQVLLDTVEEVHAIMAELKESTSHAFEALKPAGEIAAGLNSTLVELAIHMQHIALNAQIRSVLLGHGTGLEVLAARTAGISSEISDLSASTGQALADLQSKIAQMIETFGEFNTRGADELEKLSNNRTSVEQAMHALRDHTITTIFTIGTGVDAIHGSIQQLMSELDRMAEVQEAVRGVARRLNQAGVLPKGQLAGSVALPQRAEVAGMATVAAAAATDEFFVFDSPPPATASSPNPASTSTPLQSSGGLDSVWDENQASAPAKDSETSSAPATQPPSPASAPPPSPTSAPPPSPTADAPQESSPGGNVELF